MSGKLNHGVMEKIMEILRQKVWEPCRETLKNSTLKSLSVRAQHIQPFSMSRYCIPNNIRHTNNPPWHVKCFCNVYCCVAKDMFYITLLALSHSHLAMQQCWRMFACATALFTDSGGHIRKSATLLLTLTPMKRIQSSPNLYTLTGISLLTGNSKRLP